MFILNTKPKILENLGGQTARQPSLGIFSYRTQACIYKWFRWLHYYMAILKLERNYDAQES